MQLSPHFSLHELTNTNYPYKNVPNEFVKRNLKYVAQRLEDIRSALNKPIYVDSCFRSPEVNAACNGSRTSLHLVGLAVDIYINNVDYKEMPAFMQAVLNTHPYEIHINSHNIIHISWQYTNNS